MMNTQWYLFMLNQIYTIKNKIMEIKEMYDKINALLNKQAIQKLTEKELKELNDLIKMRNRVDPDSYELVKLYL